MYGLQINPSMFVKVFQRFKPVFCLRIALIWCSFVPVAFGFSQQNDEPKPLKDRNSKAQAWVDAMYNSLNEDQIIGQLFMVAAYSNKDPSHTDYLEKMIRDYHIGGLIFFREDPTGSYL